MPKDDTGTASTLIADLLQRNFYSLSVLGLTCVLMATWETMFM
jgi:hypothetical protein